LNFFIPIFVSKIRKIVLIFCTKTYQTALDTMTIIDPLSMLSLYRSASLLDIPKDCILEKNTSSSALVQKYNLA